MSQQKVDNYKKSKAGREAASRKETARRRLEIGIVIAVIVAGIIWFAVAGISRTIGSKTETVELKTEAIEEYVGSIQE